MIGIKGISSYIPSKSIDNYKQADGFDESRDFIDQKIGAKSLPVKAASEETSDMAVMAIENLVTDYDLDLKDIEGLVVITQNGDRFGLPHTSAIVQAKLELSSKVAAFDISLGCSGYVYGLSILKGLMEQAGLNNSLLVTADPYSKIVDRRDKSTSLLFGDAATASWLSEDGQWKFKRPILETDGTGANYLHVEEKLLKMNGRKVFNFASKIVPKQINTWLDLNSLAVEDIDKYIMHQGSSYIVDVIASKFPSVRDRFIKDLCDTGNTVSSSIPLLLQKHVLDSDIQKVIISGFGVGLSWATNLVYRET